MNVRVLVDNKEADYSDLKGFEFNMTARLKDFSKIVSVEGFDLKNTSKLIPFPSTKANKAIFEGKQNTILSFKLIVDNVQRVSGKCTFVSSLSKNDTITTYNVSVFAANSDFIQQINDLTLRDLDLGTTTYNSTRITGSWTGDVSIYKGIFAPVVYGKLNSNTANEWQVEDFRFHVYEDIILQGIADRLNITIDSDFRSRDIWLKKCYAFGVGKDWISTTQNSQTQTLTASSNTITFTVSVTGVYSVYVYVPATGGETGLNHVVVESSGGYVSDDYSYTDGQTTVFNIQNIKLAAGETISLIGHQSGHGLREMGISTNFSIYGGYEVVEGKDFYVSSCLHNNPIKNWFAGQVEMFNWIVFYNPITRTLKIEPAFDYVIGSTKYSGFYTSPTTAYNELDDDVISYGRSYKPLFDKIRFSYKENRFADEYLKGLNDSTLPVLGTETSIGDGTKIDKYGDKYYKRNFNGTLAGASTGSRYLPLLLDDDYRISSDVNTAETPTFLYDPTCFFVSSLTTSFTFEGTGTSGIPVLSQANIGSNDDFSLTWCDLLVNIGATTETKRGLISIFYQPLFSILKRYEVLKTKIRVSDLLSIKTFNQLYKRDNVFYLLSVLSNVKLYNELYDAELIRYFAERDGDDNDTTHNGLETAQITIQIN